jgi:hypothetical protein
MNGLQTRLNPFFKEINNFKRNRSNNTPLSWTEFNNDQVNYTGRRVVVYQKDFSRGTLRIRTGCWLQLGENISFNPNRGFDYKAAPDIVKKDKTLATRGFNWWPTRKQLASEYDKHAYHLGFFAAIAVETNNVWIDLNGFVLQQHPEHRLLQRFYSNIELTDQPFLPKQGPANFGPTVDPAENVIVSDGTIGLSSHHGIHGNNNHNIFFYNLKLKDYELSGIALNGATKVTYYKVELLGNDNKIPVLGSFSSLRFMDLFVLKFLKARHEPELGQKLVISRLAQQQIFYNIIYGTKGPIKGVDPKIYQQIQNDFINKSGLLDGNVYGILHHHTGVAVNGFVEVVEDYKTQDIFLKDVIIENTRANVTERVVLAKKMQVKNSNYDGAVEYKNLVGTTGDILQIDEIMDQNGCYKGSISDDYKIYLAKYVNKLPAKLRRHYNTLFIPDEIVEWAESGNSISQYIHGKDYKRLRNGDFMNHQQKVFWVFVWMVSRV